MIGRIIKGDMTSRLSYTITGIEKGVLLVLQNTNSEFPEHYEGPCPNGNYVTLAEFAGSLENIKKVHDGNIHITVADNGLFSIKE